MDVLKLSFDRLTCKEFICINKWLLNIFIFTSIIYFRAIFFRILLTTLWHAPPLNNPTYDNIYFAHTLQLQCLTLYESLFISCWKWPTSATIRYILVPFYIFFTNGSDSKTSLTNAMLQNNYLEILKCYLFRKSILI